MLKQMFIFNTILLYTETILELYTIFTTTSSHTIFVSSLVLIFSAYFISNLTSLIFILKEHVPTSRANRVVCFISHGILLGPVWRISQFSLFGYGVDSHILKCRLIHCGVQSLPFMVIHGAVDLQGNLIQNGGVLTFITLIVSCVSVSVTFSTFSVFTNHSDYQELQHGKRIAGIILVSLGSFLMLASRLGTIMLMASVVSFWVLLPIGCQFVFGFVAYFTITSDIRCRVKSCSPWNLVRFSVLSYFQIVDLIESNLRVIQCKYVAYYAMVLIENIVMSAVWLLYSDKEYVTKLITVVFLLVLFVCALILKYSGCGLLTNISECSEDGVSVSKMSAHFAKGGDYSYSSDAFKQFPAGLHQTASTESHTTETIISRRTSLTQKTDLEYFPEATGDIILTHRSSSFGSLNSTHKLSKRLKKRLLFGQANSLLHYPDTSTLKSTPSLPETICVSSIGVSDNIGNIIQPVRPRSRRVRGRQGFKLGFHRPYTIHGGIYFDQPVANSSSHQPDEQSHKKLQRTQSLCDGGHEKLGELQPLNVNRLPNISLWNTCSFSDSTSSFSDEDDAFDYDEGCETSFSKTTSNSANTRISFSTTSVKPWTFRPKPSFVNLDRLPTKSVEINNRIQSWLSETVNIFDLLNEKSHIDDLRASDRFNSSSTSYKTRPQEKISDKHRRNKAAISRNKTHRTPHIESSVQTVDDNLNRALRSRELRSFNAYTEFPSAATAHGNSLIEINKLKEYIQNTETPVQVNKMDSIIDFQKYKLKTNDPREQTHIVKETCGVVTQTNSCPISHDCRQQSPLYKYHHIPVRSTFHKPLVAAESLV